MKRTSLNTILLGAALAVLGSTQALAGVSSATSKHNLSDSGPTTSTATDQVCIFCHTPHGASTAAEAAEAPLWNKPVGTAGAYTVYSGPTIDGQILSVGSVSIACLSCHDGGQAVDTVLNQPGAGFNPGRIDGTAALGAITSDANLGTDLSNDHPVGVEYAEGQCTNTGAACSPVGGSGWEATNFANGAWWIDTSVAGSTAGRDKTDIILYARNFTAGAVANGIGPSVECASCHDPHNDNNQGGGQVQFLRISNAASAVCTACHTK